MARKARAELPFLPWLRSFEAAARRLNFTLAADELGLTQAAVSQQIKALEGKLGARLFERGRRGVELTPAGAAYLPHVQAAFAQLANTTRDLFGAEREEVALIAPISFSALWLAPLLPAFAAAHPQIALSVTTMHGPADYAASDADFEIRFGLGHWPGRQAHRLTTERLTPVCAPALAPRGRRDAERAFAARPLLSVRGGREMWRDWFSLAGAPAGAARPAYSFDSFVAAFEAAKAGAGILLGSRPLIDRALAARDLVRLSALELVSPSGHFLTAWSEARPGPARQALATFLLREAGRS